MNRQLMILTVFLLTSTALAALQVEDDLGHPVVLKHPARRIITLSPHATELVMALDSADRLIAIAQSGDYPDSLRNLPRLNGHGRLDREYIMRLAPDLVIAWASGNRSGDLDWLRSTGIAVFASEPATLADIGDNLLKLGILLGRPARGQQAREDFLRRLHLACPATTGPPTQVYYEIWGHPPMTIGSRHWLNQVLTLAGMRNVFADIDRSVFSVNPEALLSRHIELVIRQPFSSNSMIAHLPSIEGNAELGRPGPSLIDGLSQLCSHLNL